MRINKKVCKNHDLIKIPHLYDYNAGNNLGGRLMYTEWRCLKCKYRKTDLWN